MVYTVYTKDEHPMARLTPIKLGEIFGNEFLLDGGLEPGTTIVVEGINKVRPDSPITPKLLPRPSRRTPLSTPDSVTVPPASELGVPSPVLPADEKGASAQPDQSAPAASGSTH